MKSRSITNPKKNQNQETNEEDNQSKRTSYLKIKRKSLQVNGDQTWANQETVATGNFQCAKDQPTTKGLERRKQGGYLARVGLFKYGLFTLGLKFSIKPNQTKPASNLNQGSNQNRLNSNLSYGQVSVSVAVSIPISVSDPIFTSSAGRFDFWLA